MNQVHNSFYTSIEQMTGQLLNGTTIEKKLRGNTADSLSFQQILENKQRQELHFSKHANERLADRNIDLTEEQKERLKEGVNRASSKGIRDSLVMVDNMAFIVNVTKRTVITAVDNGDDKIFTNIDGAVIA